MNLPRVESEFFSRFVSCARGGSLLNTFAEAVARKMAGEVFPNFSAGAKSSGNFALAQWDKMNLIRAEFFEGKFRVGKLKTKKITSKKGRNLRQHNE